ncbi:1134_t:CDS:2, partial [Dentiscutata erythropus]
MNQEKDEKILKSLIYSELYKNYYYLISYNETTKKAVIKIGKITNKEIIDNEEKTLFKLTLNNAIEEAKKRICEKIIKKHQDLFDEIESRIDTSYKEELFEFLDSTIEDFVTDDIDKFIFASIFRTFTKHYYFHVPVGEEYNLLTKDEKIFFKNLLKHVIEYQEEKFETGKATISVNSFTEEEIITNKEKKMFEKLLNNIVNDFGGEILLQKYIYLQQIKLKIDLCS